MNNLQIDEITYCTHCGSANKKSAVICSECDKKIRNSYKPFYDFLKKHTKDELSGTITDTLFSYLKNYLLSHIYGAILSVTIVATALSAAYSMEPYVEKVTEPKSTNTFVQQNEPEAEQTSEALPLNEDDLYSFLHLCSNYDGFVDLLRPSESYWDQSTSYYDDVTQMYAENNIPGYSYGGIHEMISNPIPMYMLDEDPAVGDLEYRTYSSDRYVDEKSALVGENCESQIAKILYNEGYRVAECNYVLCENAGEYDYDTHTGTGYMKKLVYKVVYVEHEGNWYMVEDRLIHRENI